MTHRFDQDAVGLAARIRRREVSAKEVVESAIQRIEALNPTINTVVNARFDEAIADVDDGLPDGALTGVPILVKDLSVDVAGLPAARGSRLFVGSCSTSDSPLIARYRSAGLVVLGNTNTPELGRNATTEPLLSGPTRNPWRLTHSAGGSSGGSAAAVAAGMVSVAHGTDGGGSIRIPASMCGLFGFKPTRGRVPGAGSASSFAEPVSVDHVLTTTVRDSAVLLDVASGSLAGEPYAAPHQHRRFAAEAATPPGRLRIAFTTTAPDGREAESARARVTERAGVLCESLGHSVSEARPLFNADAAAHAASVLMLANVAATVDARLGALGRPLADDDVEPLTHMMLEGAKHLTATHIIDALRQIEIVGSEVAAFFEEYDVLLTPTVAVPTPLLGALDTTRVETIVANAPALIAFTAFLNLTGQPAMSIPGAMDNDGLPVGVQFAAGFGRDGLLFRLAGQLEKAALWRRTAPVPSGGW